jgi:hypothetical protein
MIASSWFLCPGFEFGIYPGSSDFGEVGHFGAKRLSDSYCEVESVYCV